MLIGTKSKSVWPTRVGHVLYCQTYVLGILGNLMWQWKTYCLFHLASACSRFSKQTWNIHKVDIWLCLAVWIPYASLLNDNFKQGKFVTNIDNTSHLGCLWNPFLTQKPSLSDMIEGTQIMGHMMLESKPTLYSISWTNALTVICWLNHIELAKSPIL